MWERFKAPTPETEPRDAHDARFLRRLLRNLADMAYRRRHDDDGTMEFVSEGSRKLTGFTSHELVNNRVVSYQALIHPDDRYRVWSAVEEGIKTGRPHRVTYRIRRVDGTERWVWEQGISVRGEDGEVEAIEGVVTDITDRHELTEQVAEQENQYRALVEQSLAGVYLVRTGRFAYVNPRFSAIFGYSVEELKALDSVDAIIHPDDRHLVTENLRMRLEGEVEAIRYEFRGVRKDGEICEVEVQGRRITLDDAPAVMGVLLDVTERKRAQRRYHETQKMEALGRLAAGVAHDFNNVLTIIRTTADVLRGERADDTALSADLGEIAAAVERGAALSRQLATFGRGEKWKPAAVEFADVVNALIPLLEKLGGSQVRLDVSIEPDMPTLALDPTHLEEVVMNLVINAVDAMPDGGSVTISGRMQPCGAEASSAAYREIPHAVLEVTDNGPGMPPEVLRRLFEPYFTTKGDRGTGLGLANVWRIATDAGGVVVVDSEVGRGSTFSVLLPVRHP